MSDDLKQKVLEELERHGAALELRVSRAFRYSGFEVRDGVTYTDPITGKQREADITVRRNSHRPSDPSFVAVVECKHSPGKAWVAIQGLGTTSRSQNDAQHWFAVPAPDSDFQEALAVGTGKTFLRWGTPATRIITTDARNGEKNTAADAARQAVSACLGHISSLAIFWPGDDPTDAGSMRFNQHFGIAIVITTAPLFTAHLDDSGQIQAEQVDRFEVMIDNGDGVMRPVIAMNEKALTEFVTAFNPAITAS